MMIHTYELAAKISLTEERLLDKKLTAFFNAAGKYDGRKKIRFYGEYSKIPFKLGIKTVRGNRGIFNYLIVIVNPMKTIENDYINVASSDIALAAHEKLKETFEEIGIGDYFSWLTLKRIDYTFNIDLKTQDLVETYIKLMKRGDIPNHFTPRTYRDEKSHRQVTYEDSIYMENQGGTIINFYNKYNQIVNEAKHFIDCDKAIGILRLEVQCNRRKIASLGKRYEISANNPQDYFDEQIAEDVAIGSLLSIVKYGDYYNLNDAKDIINGSRFNDRQKLELIGFLKEVNTARSLNLVKKSGKYSKDKYKKMLRWLSELNINPVTIPVKWGYSYLSNLINFI